MGAAMVEAGVAVKALLQGAAPERKQEIEDLWRNELDRTKLTVDEMAPLWNRIGESFGGALNGMITGAQTWRSALATRHSARGRGRLAASQILMSYQRPSSTRSADSPAATKLRRMFPPDSPTNKYASL